MHREYAVLILMASAFSMAWNKIVKASAYTEEIQLKVGALHNLLPINRPFSYFQDWNATSLQWGLMEQKHPQQLYVKSTYTSFY